MRGPRPRVGLPLLLLAAFCPPASSVSQGLASAGGTTVSEIGGWTEAEEGDGLAFGVALFNPSGETLEFRWDFGDASDEVNGPGLRAVTHRYRQDGEYTVRLRVTGSQGFSALRRLDVRIEAASPTVHLLSYDEPPGPGRPVAFHAEASDPGQDTLTYVWDFGDGSPPERGVDLREVSHRYASAEEVVVTLRVLDEDGLADVRTLTLAPPGLEGTLDGAVSAELDGRPDTVDWPGYPTSVFPVAPTTTGGCTYSASFVDEGARATVSLTWIPAAGQGSSPGRFDVVGMIPLKAAPGFAKIPGPGDAFASVSLAENDQSWAMMRRSAEAAEGGADALAGTVMPNMMFGPVWTFLSRSGTLEIESAGATVVRGSVNLVLQGMRMPPQSANFRPFGETVTLKGRFTWPIDPGGQAVGADCGDRGFAIESHTPTAEAENIDFREPGISLTLTRPFKRETLTDRTLQVGYLDDAHRFVPIDGTIRHDSDRRTVHFAPEGELLDAVFYHVRVKGGAAGVRSVADEMLAEDYEWRFVTVVDLLPPP